MMLSCHTLFLEKPRWIAGDTSVDAGSSGLDKMPLLVYFRAVVKRIIFVCQSVFALG